MFETALITSGFNVDSPRSFADHIYEMITLVTGSDAFGSTQGQNETVEGEVMEK